MVTEAIIKSKSDGELLEIWAGQNEYRGEVIDWVQAEIIARRLDAGGVHVRTVREIYEEEEAGKARVATLLRSLKWGAAGLVVVVGALSAGFDGWKERGGNELVFGAGALGIGVFLIWITARFCRGKR